MKSTAFILSLITYAALPAYALDRQDVGDYVLLNQQERPTPSKMRFTLQENGQWVMDGKQGDGAWQPVCRGTGTCRLVAASANEVAQWKAVLPQHWQAHHFSCIRNVAFAFCRVTDKDNANRRAYWWFALINNQIHALPVKRIVY